MMRYYDLDADGYILGSNKKPQPGEDLKHLDEPDESFIKPRWIGPGASDWKEGQTLEDEREQMILTRYQARAALLNAGLLDDVEALMADAETPRSIRLVWEHKQQIRRTHQAMIDMAAKLGWTDQQIDELFRAGMEIEP